MKASGFENLNYVKLSWDTNPDLSEIYLNYIISNLSLPKIHLKHAAIS